MPLIDLGSPAPAPLDLLDGLPRRVTLTLPELRFVAERAAGAPLPFDLAPPRSADTLEGRLGRSRASTEDAAYVDALSRLHDPATSLSRRGLLHGSPDDGELDAGLVGAVGLLATPEIAIDLDVAAGDVHARSWHRQSGRAVASLSTVDGIVFELAWFPITSWSDELRRIAVMPEEAALTSSEVPPCLDLPFELADAASEAMRTSRSDLVSVLVAQRPGADRSADGSGVDDATVGTALAALTTENRGRLRVLVADVSGTSTDVVGVVSWTLVADGWRALRPHDVDGELYVEVRRVTADDLPGDLAPVLAEVVSGVSV